MKKLGCLIGMLAINLWIVGLLSCTCGDGIFGMNNDDTNDDAEDTNDIEPPAGWYIYTVLEDDYGSGEFSSLGVDSKGYAHISFHGDYVKLGYMTNASGEWKISFLDNTSAYYTCIALDRDDKVHISYYMADERNLRYATNSVGAWQIFDIDTPENIGTYSSLALDSGGKVHISYFECGEEEELECKDANVKYATNKSGVWQRYVVEEHTSIDGADTSIAVGTDGRVHIVYFCADCGDFDSGMIYMVGHPGAWTRFIVDGDGSFWNSLALDSLGHAHIAYSSRGNSVRYATNALGTWQIMQIDTGDYPSLALDSDGHVCMAYSAASGLVYCTNKSGNLEKTLVYSGEVAYVSLDVDSDNYAHISFYDSENKHLKYATNRPPE